MAFMGANAKKKLKKEGKKLYFLLNHLNFFDRGKRAKNFCFYSKKNKTADVCRCFFLFFIILVKPTKISWILIFIKISRGFR